MSYISNSFWITSFQGLWKNW